VVRPNRQKGFILIAMSVCMFLLLAVVGMAFDMGRVYIARNEAQIFADAAAMAAAKQLDGTAAGLDRNEIRARRLEEVGALANAMMPEIETLVSTAYERGHDLRRQMRDGQATAADAEGVVALTASINALIRQLATFSRRQLREAESIDLSEAVTRTEPVLLRLVGDFITFALHLAPARPVLTDREDFDQLLTSMVTFGRDLLTAGGSLTIEVRPAATANAAGGISSSTVLAVVASGYGVHLPTGASAIELVAQRCGAELSLGGEPGWLARLEAHFPRCGKPPQAGWAWSGD